VQQLLLLSLLAALACLTVFQTNRSIFVRSLGLFVILAAELVQEFELSRQPNLGLAVFMLCLVGLGFASDFYSATLRTWYFRVSEQAIWGVLIGGFVGALLTGLMPFAIFQTTFMFLFGSLIGGLIGELRARGFRSVPQLGKAVLGSFVGVFGMSVKLLLGIEMAYWFLILHTLVAKTH